MPDNTIRSTERWHGRFKVKNAGGQRLLAQLQSVDGARSITCMVDNISIMGARLNVVDELETGTEWLATLNDGRSFREIGCVVRWQSDIKKGEGHAGVEFTRPYGAEAMERLAQDGLLERSVCVRQPNRLSAVVRGEEASGVAEASVVNLSTDGICLAAYRPFQADRHISVEVFTNHGTVGVDAIVRWSESHVDAFLTGCQFTDDTNRDDLCKAARLECAS